MRKLSALLKTIDNNLLTILLTAFVFIIPLYPKLPFHFVTYTYIAIRLEDFYVAFIAAVFVIQLLRKKASLHPIFTKPIVLFWGTVFLAVASGIFITKTLPYHNLALLHAARRVEYMIIFFVAVNAVRSRKQFNWLLGSLIVSFALVCFYGIGQRFFNLPAVSTMNPEFAKGHILFLTPEARISSTFGGHYDLAAFLVLTLPIIFGTFLATKKKVLLHFSLYAIFVMGVFILMLTASRSSFLAYIVSTPLFLLYVRKYRHFAIVLAFSLALVYSQKELTQRLLKTFQIKQILVNEQTGQVVVSQRISSKELPAGTSFIQINDRKQSSEAAVIKQQSINEAIKEATKSGLGNVPGSTDSANYKEVSAVATDISFATRLQVEWPRAINALLKNPLLGTGPSSITESTDNDYLRWLGEFGLLGFGLFLFIIYSMGNYVRLGLTKLEDNEQFIFKALLFGMGGLLINAGYIDVFEASKVAYIFWYTMGIFIGRLDTAQK
ncbi:MAG: O-antigen ligase family protein [Microgenomates group bacterium]